MEMITYEYDCGHKVTYTVEAVLHLSVEPNWGCNECETSGAKVVDIKEFTLSKVEKLIL